MTTAKPEPDSLDLLTAEMKAAHAHAVRYGNGNVSAHYLLEWAARLESLRGAERSNAENCDLCLEGDAVDPRACVTLGPFPWEPAAETADPLPPSNPSGERPANGLGAHMMEFDAGDDEHDLTEERW